MPLRAMRIPWPAPIWSSCRPNRSSAATRNRRNPAGMGGGEQDDNKISEREKEIIAATWNQIKDTSGRQGRGTENAGFLSGVQSKLRDQAHSLSERMKARQLAGASEEFKTFTAEMDEAVKAMGPAADKLRVSQWRTLLAPEQKALQHLLRAEAVMRDIKVAFGNRGGGGGGASGADRDLQSLFDLELDTEKNQYESGQQRGFEGSAAARNRRGSAEARTTRAPAAGTGRTAAPEPAGFPTALAAGDAAPRSRRAAAQDGAAIAQQPAGAAAIRTAAVGPIAVGPIAAGAAAVGAERTPIRPGRPDVLAAIAARHRAVAAGPAGHAPIDFHARAKRMRGARPSACRRRATCWPACVSSRLRGSVDDLARQAESTCRPRAGIQHKMRKAFGAPGQQQGRGRDAAAGRGIGARKGADRPTTISTSKRKWEQAARDTRATNRQLSSKLREALGQVQQNEINNRCARAPTGCAPAEAVPPPCATAVTTQALNNLRDQLQEIQKSRGQRLSRESGDKDRQALEQALAQTERLAQRNGTRHWARVADRAVSRPADRPARSAAGQQTGPAQRGQPAEPGSKPASSPARDRAIRNSGQSRRGTAGPDIGPRTNGRQSGLNPGPGPAWGDAGDFIQNYPPHAARLENNPQIGKGSARYASTTCTGSIPRWHPAIPELMNRIESQMLTEWNRSNCSCAACSTIKGRRGAQRLGRTGPPRLCRRGGRILPPPQQGKITLLPPIIFSSICGAGSQPNAT